ncbi:volume-regulated anion channel subunit LRRC8D [Megalops cyprinoides]|uniref:volume-regulated anion channel subunit LRRC8D n=1 Tax=Megalops cyprinoides TaxID=118141 RepID=UPI001863FE5B|nr:volume-regulated anion channel subunit LRRC8D [Megalops cyprinoides]
MFTLSELASLHDRQGSYYRLLKPWWEVFMEYLVVLMLMVSVLAGTLLLSRDGVVCLPVYPQLQNHSSPSHADPQPKTLLHPSRNSLTSDPHPTSTPSNHIPPPQTLPRGRRTHLDYQQYMYISQVCYHEALPWYSRYFPYVALLQSLVLLASGCFWFHFPLTSARIEHFLAILGKCCESPWTSRALSHTAWLESTRTQGDEGGPTLPSAPPSRATSIAGQSSLDSGTDSPPLVRCDSTSPAPPPSPCPSTLSRSSSLSSLSFSAPSHPSKQEPAPTVMPDSRPQTASLDRSDGEQARALFERVRRFRAHCESSDIIFRVYLAQTVFKVLKFLLIVSYTAPLLGSISFTHTCQPRTHALTGYSTFQCTHSLASVLRKLLLAYVFLVSIFGVLGIYTLAWICHRSLRRYSFQHLREWGSMRDVPDLCNDLAFLLHMADQYDPLLAQRLSVFLSPISETRLLEENLERQWGEARLHSMTSTDPHGRTQLQLVALPHLPCALYSLSHLEVLKLELITEAKLTTQLSHMTSLRELHLYHCPAVVEPAALLVLQDRLESLYLTFTLATEIPSWVYTLRGLQELHLTGRLGGEGGSGRGWVLGSLRQLRHLRVLALRGALQRVPAELAEVAGSLLRLEIHNDGARLLVLTALRRTAGLAELQLEGCQLERLPSPLLALTSLRCLDLRHNRLRTLEGLLGLQHLRRLTCLRLAHNRVLTLPPSVGMLRALELLDLGHNQLQKLPPALFTLHHLRRLLLTGNLLEELPPDVGSLLLLNELDLSGNRLESLPPALFTHCMHLRTLNMAHNSLVALPPGQWALHELSQLDLRGNSMDALPAELGSCVGLRGGGLLVEDWLLFSLPPHIREFLLKPNTLPSTSTEGHSQPDLDIFPTFSTAQWSFLSALESQI